MRFKCIFTMAILCFYFSVSNAQTRKYSKKDKVTFSSLLKVMISRDELSKYPKSYYTFTQFSSYDRRSTAINDSTWFANSDSNYFIREEVVLLSSFPPDFTPDTAVLELEDPVLGLEIHWTDKPNPTNPEINEVVTYEFKVMIKDGTSVPFANVVVSIPWDPRLTFLNSSDCAIVGANLECNIGIISEMIDKVKKETPENTYDNGEV